jgi:hypothetical protein
MIQRTRVPVNKGISEQGFQGSRGSRDPGLLEFQGTRVSVISGSCDPANKGSCDFRVPVNKVSRALGVPGNKGISDLWFQGSSVLVFQCSSEQGSQGTRGTSGTGNNTFVICS